MDSRFFFSSLSGHIPFLDISAVWAENRFCYHCQKKEGRFIWIVKEKTTHISSTSTVCVIAKLSTLHRVTQMAVSRRKKASLNHRFFCGLLWRSVMLSQRDIRRTLDPVGSDGKQHSASYRGKSDVLDLVRSSVWVRGADRKFDAWIWMRSWLEDPESTLIRNPFKAKAQRPPSI